MRQTDGHSGRESQGRYGPSLAAVDRALRLIGAGDLDRRVAVRLCGVTAPTHAEVAGDVNCSGYRFDGSIEFLRIALEAMNPCELPTAILQLALGSLFLPGTPLDAAAARTLGATEAMRFAGGSVTLTAHRPLPQVLVGPAWKSQKDLEVWLGRSHTALGQTLRRIARHSRLAHARQIRPFLLHEAILQACQRNSRTAEGGRVALPSGAAPTGRRGDRETGRQGKEGERKGRS